MRSVFLFRRDLRLYDNTALIAALEESETVIPIFIFNPEQIENNPYKGDHSFEFLLNSLEDLNKQLQQKGTQLYCFYGNPVTILSNISFDTLYFNRDYTPFSKKRDEELAKHFKTISKDGCLLNPPEKIIKKNNTPYSIFTPYYNKCLEFEVEHPIECKYSNFFKEQIKNTVTIQEIRKKHLKKSNPNLAVKGGRAEGLKLLEKLKKNLENYQTNRDLPYVDGVSKLSAHNKFGTISPRELYYESKQAPMFTRQLYWRDFYTQIAFHFPHVFGKNFNTKFDSINWDYDKELFEKWCKGETGFPIVDAGMRELNKTGYMHNRVRMIVASFLTKDLHIDWRWGEQYFAQQLVDYDPCVNNGSWQWAASTGCDAQPYFRIFNPWRQQIRFDPNCLYIKKWIEEIKNLPPKAIHELEKQQPLGLKNYPRPIVNHFVEKEETLKRFN